MRHAILSLAIAVLFPATYTQADGGQQRRAQQSYNPIQVSEDAKRRAQDFWNARLTRCGNSHFTRLIPNGNIFEFRGLEIGGETFQLSEVDRLNGIEYRGVIRVSYSATREYHVAQNNWGQWTSDNQFTRTNRITKIRGQWNIEEGSTLSLSNGLTQITCNEAQDPAGSSRAYNRKKEEEAVSGVVAEFRRKTTSYNNGGTMYHDVYGNNLPVSLWKHLSSAYKDLSKVVFLPNGGWLVTHSFSPWQGDNVPQDILDAANNGMDLRTLTTGLNGAWIMLGKDERGDNGTGNIYRNFYGKNLSAELMKFLKDLYDKQQYIYRVSLAPDGGWLVNYGEKGRGNYEISSHMQHGSTYDYPVPSDGEAMLFFRANKSARVTGIAYTPDGGNLVISGQNYFTKNLPADVEQALRLLHGKAAINSDQLRVAFGYQGEWLVWIARN